ncbi:MAG: hypothetical protein M3406_12115 [Chloroflexota bacterium]|nr:hypothetical protein [Chloroflexota bacterium]
MRRFIVPIIVVPMLLLALAVPTLAAPPLKESGTSKYFSSYSTACTEGGSPTCTDTSLEVFSISPDTVVVCVSTYTYSTRTYRTISQESGCTETSSDALTFTADFTVSLADTSVTVSEFSCGPRRCTEGGTRTITVSASDSAVGEIFSSSGRGTFSDGTCTYRYSFSEQSAELAGTMTIDGVTMDQFGWGSLSQYSVTTRC